MDPEPGAVAPRITDRGVGCGRARDAGSCGDARTFRGAGRSRDDGPDDARRVRLAEYRRERTEPGGGDGAARGRDGATRGVSVSVKRCGYRFRSERRPLVTR